MGLSHFLHQLLLMPLELVFEVIYGLSFNLFHNNGLSIFLMSLCMNLLLLPLYRRADLIQEEERETEKRLQPGVDHIKKTFSGDERFMVLQAYYRKNGYKPYFALKGSLPLMLEIPFFIAAYRFLSNLDLLRGAAFGPIPDLSAPDALFSVGGLSLPLLPILMTLINFISSAIYTRGLPRKDKVQLYGMALIFLVLLYRSPSGLVLYWTLNNLFSLVKNMIGKLPNGNRALSILFRVFGFVLLIYGIAFFRSPSVIRGLALITLGLLLELPLLTQAVQRYFSLPKLQIPEANSTPYYVGGAAFLTLLTGALIPSAVIASSPEEFFHTLNYYSPLLHILNSTLLAAGFFFVWFALFYFLADHTGKWIICGMLWFTSGIAIVDYMFFGTRLGKISSQLVYDDGLLFSLREKLLNLAVLLVLLALLALIWYKRRNLVRWTYPVLSAAIFGMSLLNMVHIQAAVPEIKKLAETSPEEQVTFRLSRNGKNVVVLMIDKAIGAYVPYLFQERPEFERQFEGFVYYPNTVSFGNCTNIGSPALYGGYEYTPEEMNKRDNEPLEKKHTEALLVMPSLFSSNGYETTVVDPSWAGYSYVPDLSIYDNYPGIHAYHAEYGQILYEGNSFMERVDSIWARNFFCFSVMKTLPLPLQPYAYQYGLYFEPGDSDLSESVSYSRITKLDFLFSYSVLRALPDITQISEDTQNTFLCLANCTTHNAALLQEPDYEPAVIVDNRAYDSKHWDRFTWNGQSLHMQTQLQMRYYQSQMATFIQLGSWFDSLRQNGVYDNTRIIIVSDHGAATNQLDSMMFGPAREHDAMEYNALLMVKDFGSQSFLTDERFMTNADTVSIATDGLLDDPVNPFTGVPLSSAAKGVNELHISGSYIWDTGRNNGNTFLPGPWYAVHDDVRIAENWSFLGEH